MQAPAQPKLESCKTGPAADTIDNQRQANLQYVMHSGANSMTIAASKPTRLLNAHASADNAFFEPPSVFEMWPPPQTATVACTAWAVLTLHIGQPQTNTWCC
jgi:hypothetical protein